MNSERSEVRVVSECDVFQVLRKVESCYASVGEKFSVHVHDADLIEADFGQNTRHSSLNQKDKVICAKSHARAYRPEPMIGGRLPSNQSAVKN